MIERQIPGTITPISKRGFPASAARPFGKTCSNGHMIRIGIAETSTYQILVCDITTPLTVINRQTNRFTIIPNRSLKNKATGISHNSETVRNNTAINAPFTGTCVVRRKPPSVAPANTITLENKIMYPI